MTSASARSDFPPYNSELEVSNPYDGSLVGTAPCAGIEHAEAALDAAAAAYADRAEWLPLHRRIEILHRLAELMRNAREELVGLALAEGGKPRRDTEIEVARAIDSVELAAEHIRAHAGEVIPMGQTAASAGRMAFTQHEPIGVALAFCAFNHPLNLVAHQLAPAVAAGCPAIIKPAPDTPLSCLRFVELLHAAGLPPHWCQVAVTDQLAVAERLVNDERLGFFSFIGSAKVGWMLRSKLAPGVRCSLEHGGIAPVVVMADADLDAAVTAVLKGGFYHAGQVCVSVQRVFVMRDVAEKFACALADKAKTLKIGDPADEGTDVGPLIRPSEIRRVDEWVHEALDAGARALCGAQALDNNCYACTVLYDPDEELRVSAEEIFGPLVCVYPCEDLDEALRRANASPFAFQAAVFTSNMDAALAVYRGIDASAVMVNDHTAFRIDGMPFAGLHHSGLGVGGIPHAIEDMSVAKMMVLNSPALL